MSGKAPDPQNSNRIAALGQAWAHQQAGRLAEAEALYREVLKKLPADADALHMLGLIESQRGNTASALSYFERALAANPHDTTLLVNRGNALLALKRFADASTSYERVLALEPKNVSASFGRAIALTSLGRLDDAVTAYSYALAIDPTRADAHLFRGYLLQRLRRHEEAFAGFDRAYRTAPDLPWVEGARLFAKMALCDWKDLAQERRRLLLHAREGKNATVPFVLMVTEASAADQFSTARAYASVQYPAHANPVWRGEVYDHKKIRVGYMSSDFQDTPVAYVTADLFECHNRENFEIHGLATGMDDGSPLRKRLRAAFDRFHVLENASDDETAGIIRRAEIDILVDLNGYSGQERSHVFAARPAPIQVNYLGYPGTMGAPYIDYLMADRIVIPESERRHYSEKIVYLPHCYLPADRKRTPSQRAFTRAGQGLPESGFVFCCLSTSHKLNPEMFDIWMRLLKAVPGSVLWLAGPNESVKRNLKREAGMRGVDASRLVFARYVGDSHDHLARLSLADLFLDTLPYNAHTTTTDAIAAGVPVVTALGTTFPARVAASVLTAAGLRELAAGSLAEYEHLALALARDRVRLKALADKLAKARTLSPLFDTPRFARNLEAAYRAMRERQARGLAPQSFAVPGE